MHTKYMICEQCDRVYPLYRSRNSGQRFYYKNFFLSLVITEGMSSRTVRKRIDIALLQLDLHQIENMKARGETIMYDESNLLCWECKQLLQLEDMSGLSLVTINN